MQIFVTLTEADNTLNVITSHIPQIFLTPGSVAVFFFVCVQFSPNHLVLK